MNTNKIILFLGGIAFGLIIAMLLLQFYKNSLIVELDLGQISLAIAKTHGSKGSVDKEFKERFQMAMSKIPRRTIIVRKGQILSKHKVRDHTEQFLQDMGINDGK